MRKILIAILMFLPALLFMHCSGSNADLEKGCLDGNFRSCTTLGVHYAFATHGKKKDYAKAKYYFEKSCNANEADGCKELVFCMSMAGV